MLRGLCILALLVCLAAPAIAETTPVPAQMNFQGRLARPDGTPVPDGSVKLTLRLFDAPTGGNLRHTDIFTSVPVRNGVFAVRLGTGSPLTASVLNGSVFLEIQVNDDPPLTPRQPLLSVAYALKADSVKDGAVTSASIADGTITAVDFAPNTFNSLAWLLGGNSGVTNSFLGTTDDSPLEFRANNRRAMRYEYAENTTAADFRSINVLGGADINEIAAGVTGATVAGGGQDFFSGTDSPNRVLSDFGTVGGGRGNVAASASATVAGGISNSASGGAAAIGGGNRNRAEGSTSTVGGGFANHAAGDTATVAGGNANTARGIVATIGGGDNNLTDNLAATIGGGGFNTASGESATVAGGFGNTASGESAAIGGGFSNIASGFASIVPGGDDNTAAGIRSFAAGRRARANHSGTFVWADNQNVDFASTNINQFLVRASGGVAINSASPRGDLDLRSLSGNADLYMQAFDATVGVNFGVTAGQTLNISAFNGTSFTNNLTLFATGNAILRGTLTQNSDVRWKKDIAPMEDALDRILNLRGVTYEWKDADRAPGRQIGFIAQEVEAVLPELVHTDEQGLKSVAYQNVVPVLVEAVKQQQKQIDAVQRENAELRARLKQHEQQLTQIEELKRRLDALSTR